MVIFVFNEGKFIIYLFLNAKHSFFSIEQKMMFLVLEIIVDSTIFNFSKTHFNLS